MTNEIIKYYILSFVKTWHLSNKIKWNLISCAHYCVGVLGADKVTAVNNWLFLILCRNGFAHNLFCQNSSNITCENHIGRYIEIRRYT